MSSRISPVSRGTLAAACAVALPLAGLLSGCGTTATKLGTPQSIATALPSPGGTDSGQLATDFPAINTRFVLPHLTKSQTPPTQAYITWTIATSLSLRSGRMDPRVEKLSSADMFTLLQTQVKQLAQYSSAGGWGPIVQRVQKVQLSRPGANLAVCTTTTDAQSGKKTKQSLLVQMAKQHKAWSVAKVYHLSVKLPHC